MSFSSVLSWFVVLMFLQQGEIIFVSAEKVLLHPGKPDTLRIQISVKEGYHIQANRLKDESLIPTSISFPKKQEEIITGEALFPKAKKLLLTGTEDSLDVFDGHFEMAVPIKAEPNLRAGNYLLHAIIRYQPCDHRSCLFPRTKEFDVEVEVGGN